MTNKAPRPILLLLSSLALVGCAALPQPDIDAPQADLETVQSALPDEAGSLRYRIDAAKITLKTYRAGWLAGLAHSHVMTTERVVGEILLAEDRSRSVAMVTFRPWDLVLDDPEERANAGAGFESERSQADIEATRTRMLGPRGFDSNVHPFVTTQIRWQAQDEVGIEISFRDDVVSVNAPVRWQEADGRIEATSAFTLTHQDLSLKPYSAFLGALAVAQPIDVSIELSASRVAERVTDRIPERDTDRVTERDPDRVPDPVPDSPGSRL